MSGRAALSIRAGHLLLMVHEMNELPRILLALSEAGLAHGKGGERLQRLSWGRQPRSSSQEPPAPCS